MEHEMEYRVAVRAFKLGESTLELPNQRGNGNGKFDRDCGHSGSQGA